MDNVASVFYFGGMILEKLEAKITSLIDDYCSHLNEDKLANVIKKYLRYRQLLWGVPILLWLVSLILVIIPFHTLDHGFLLLWLLGVIGLVGDFVVNRMLINFTTRRMDLNQDERIDTMTQLRQTMDYQVVITFGGIAALPFAFTMIPYTQFLLDHPTLPGMTRQMLELVAGPGLFNNLIWIATPILITIYMLTRVRKSEMDHRREIENWMAHYEYHNVKLHKLLEGHTGSKHEPNIVLGKSIETGDYVVQTSTTRRQNTVVFGPIGSGKTSTVFIPQICQDIEHYLQYIRDYKKASQSKDWMKPHKLATHYLNGINVIDPTNDLCKEVYSMCMKLGVPKEKVIWLDPENERTPSLNLLRGPVEKAAENVTNIISGLKGGNNDFFKQSERTHLKNMIYLLKLTSVMDGKIASFGDLIQMYNDIELVWEKMGILDDYCEVLRQREDEAKDAYEADGEETSKIRFEEIQDKYAVAWQTSQWFHKNIQVVTVGKNVRTYDSGPHKGDPMHYDVQDEFVRGLVNTLEDISKNIPIRRVLFRDSGDFNLDDFLYNGGILLCNTAKAVVGDQLAEILGQIYTLSFQAATYRRDPNCPPLHPLYADEFPDYLSESFSGFASQARKYNVPIEIVAQSPAQLAYKYGNNYFDTLMSVMLTRMTFGDLGASDAQKLEPLFGEHEEIIESINNQEIDIAADQDSNRKMVSSRREKVPNISASEIMSLEKFTLAVRTPGQHSSDMFNRIRVSRVTDEALEDDPYKFDLGNKQDRESYEYMLEHEKHDNPDFDEIDKEIMAELKQKKQSNDDKSSEQAENKGAAQTFFDDNAEIDNDLVNNGGHKTAKDIKQRDSDLLRKGPSEKDEMGHDDKPHVNFNFGGNINYEDPDENIGKKQGD